MKISALRTRASLFYGGAGAGTEQPHGLGVITMEGEKKYQKGQGTD